MRTLTNLSTKQAEANNWIIPVPLDSEVVGKAIFEEGDIRIMKSTKRFKVDSGWVYNTSTEYHKGTNVSVAEALAFVPRG